MKTHEKINFSIIILSIVLLISLLNSCTENEWEKKEKEEMQRIDYYLSQLRTRLTPDQQIIEVKVNELDAKMYIVKLAEENPDGISPQTNDFMILSYSGRNINEEIRETTYSSESQYWYEYKNNPYYFRNYLFVPKKIPFGKSFPGINIGLSRIKEGDSCIFIIPSKLAFYDKDFTTLVYYIKLHKVIRNIKEYDSLQMVFFKDSLKINSSNFILSDNVFYKEIVYGDSTQNLLDADSVVIQMTASYMQDNELIDFINNKEITLPLGSTKNYWIDKEIPVTTGLASVLDTLKIGTKAIVLVPYNKAYGENGLFSYLGFLIVPQYTSIVYNLNVKNKVKK